MSISSEHKALIFVGFVAVLGAGVRVLRASGAPVAPAIQPALEHQIAAADSAKKASAKGKKKAGSTARRATHSSPDSAAATKGVSTKARRDEGPLDRPGYVNGRLDLDIATAPQVDSLPGVSSTMARRIVADRMQRGPFLSIDAVRRVPGAGAKFIERIDTLVMFSGTLRHPSPQDSIIPPRTRAKPSSRPNGG